MNPRKKRRIEESLRRELSTIILYELKDPRAESVTVTGVELSNDSRSAKVRVVVHGQDEETQRALHGLSHASGYMQALIGKRLKLRYTPILSFAEDKELQRVMRVEKLIDQARQDDQRTEP